MSNTTYDLGRVGLNLRGEYSSTAAYEPLDVATWQGSSYVASESTTGIRPSDEAKWTMLAQGAVSPICMEEQRTGLNWINGKPIYAKMFMLPAPTTMNASLEYFCDFSGMEDVWIDPSNTFLRRKDNGSTYHAGYIAGDAGRQFCVMPNRDLGVLVVVSDSEGTVYVRLLYTKAADVATKYQLPFLSASNDQGCIVTASSQANTNAYPAYKAFNGLRNDWWQSGGTDAARWIQVQMPYKLRNMVVSLTDRTLVNEDHRRANVAGKFSGSNDGATWTELLSFSGRNPNYIASYTSMHALANDVGYKYLRYTPATTTYDPAENFSTTVADIRISGEIVA